MPPVIYIGVIVTRNERDLYQEVHGDSINVGSNSSLKGCQMSLNLGPSIYPTVKRVNTPSKVQNAQQQLVGYPNFCQGAQIR